MQGDAASLHRLAVILLDNAIKYAGTGGAVTLRLAAAGSQAVLTVHNTGTPIPPDRPPHIFERFYKMKGSREDSMGLGMAFTKSMIAYQNGEVKVKSKKGEGTTFIVKIYKNDFQKSL